MKVTKQTQESVPVAVPLYVFRRQTGTFKGAITTATFEKDVSDKIAKAFGIKYETHEAKELSTKGMYGRLLGLSGIQRKGGLASIGTLSQKEINERMDKARKVKALVVRTKKAATPLQLAACATARAARAEGMKALKRKPAKAK